MQLHKKNYMQSTFMSIEHAIEVNDTFRGSIVVRSILKYKKKKWLQYAFTAYIHFLNQ